MSWPLCCPACGAALGCLPNEATALDCRRCGASWACRGGVWELLPPEGAARFTQFLHDYGTVRRAEGRGSADPEWYGSLPYVPAGDPLAWQWRIRARSWESLAKDVLPGVGRAPRRVLDLGAGNGWLSFRLAEQGDIPLAVDVWADAVDGLGAARHFDAILPSPFPRLRAEFDRLPLADACADLTVFDASFHYSADYDATLAEALRVTAPRGAVVIFDSPVYRSEAAGQAMVAERRADFTRRFGFPSDALGSREYLSEPELDRLALRHSLVWHRHEPWYGLSWALRPWRARLARRREPARFAVLVARRAEEP